MGLFIHNINLDGKFTGVFPQAPVAKFTATPTTANTSTLAVAFTDSSSGSPVSWLWDFKNDGSATSTQQNPTYTYTTPGTYSVKLTVTNSVGVTNTTTSTNLISFAPPPVASFTGTPTIGQPPLTVNFTDSSTGSPTSWAWDFTNDGATDSTAQNPSYTYTSTGTYSVKLTATSQWGSSTSTQVNYITVSDAPPPPSDQYFAYTTLELPGTGTNDTNNNTFLDSSSNNFAITRFGNTTQGSFSPFSTASGYWSNYFDGTNSWLTVPSNSNLNMFGGSFTIELWVFPLAFNANNYNYLICQDDGGSNNQNFILRLSSTGAVDFIYYTSSNRNNVVTLSSNNTLSLNTWSHLAVVCNGSTVKIYVNGTEAASSSSIPWAGSSVQTAIGNWSTGVNQNTTFSKLNAYLSNIRMIKGSAVYTGNFTPSTTPLTAVSGTSLLTCQNNRFIDNSSNSFTITSNGNTYPSTLGPFVPTSAYDASTMGGSMYFDGSGDTVVAPAGAAFAYGTGAFTIEAWVNTSAYNSGPYDFEIVFCQTVINRNYLLTGITIDGYPRFVYGNSGGTWITGDTKVPLNTWTHLAWVREGTGSNQFKIYMNGVVIATSTVNFDFNDTSYNPTIGDYTHGPALPFKGYISNLRVVKGTAVYTSNFTPPTAPVGAISGTSLLLNGTNGAIYDVTAKNTPETLGDAKISTTISANGSIYFDGSGDYLRLPANTNMQFGTGDFTVEFYMYPTSLSSCSVFDMRLPSNTTGAGFEIYQWNSSLYVATTDENWATPSNAITINTWQHIALTRSGSSIRLFVNGVQKGNTFTINYNLTNNIVRIGQGGIPGNYSGYMNNLRITKGIARYTSNFTPPARS